MASTTPTIGKIKPSSTSFSRDKSFFIAIFCAILLVCVIWSFTDPFPNFSALLPAQTFSVSRCAVDRGYEPSEKSFYDDPELSYTIDKPMVDWNKKRLEWMKLHPSFAPAAAKRVLLLTGSHPDPCKNKYGDHLLLRFFKNKVDYCRIHGYEIFYSNAFFHPEMRSFWAKIPFVRAAMLAHPESEWVMWIDSDAIFTDMDFKIPLDRYKDHNFVVHGWREEILKKSWTAVNAGIFLIRNCQWSMEFLDVWATMGPQSPDYKKWGQIQRSTFKDKMFPESDDQTALVYLLLKGEKKWRDKMYVENEYSLHGYWVGVVGRLENITARYVEIERREQPLRRRHAEAVSESYAAAREPHVAEGGDWRDGWRRPFITHFTGCQPCSGDHNPAYNGNSCLVGMERALNFADNQILRNFGFMHSDLNTLSPILPVPHDYSTQQDFDDFV